MMWTIHHCEMRMKKIKKREHFQMAIQFQLKARDDSQSESNANFGEQTIR